MGATTKSSALIAKRAREKTAPISAPITETTATTTARTSTTGSAAVARATSTGTASTPASPGIGPPSSASASATGTNRSTKAPSPSRKRIIVPCELKVVVALLRPRLPLRSGAGPGFSRAGPALAPGASAPGRLRGHPRVQHLADLAREPFRAERLLDEGDVGVEHASLRDRVPGVAGHEEHAQAGAQRRELLGQLAPVHLRHDQVRDEQVERARLPRRQRQGLASVLRGDHALPLADQDPLCESADRGLVLHEQDGLVARARGHVPPRRGTLDRRLHARQVDLERGPLPRLAVDPDEPTALLDDAVHGREPEPRALALFLGREERLEDVRLDGARDARARVGHR